jgi:tetratricopeptide (TPR) repeat protein
LLTDARRMAVDVAKRPGATQRRAQELLAQLGHTTTLQTSQVEVTTFAEALTAGQESLAQRRVAAGTVSLLSRRIPQITDAQQRQEMEDRLKTAQQQLQKSDQKALRLFEQARLLADEETPLEQLNLVRFYLCSLHYYAANYCEAAVLASFLSRHFPESVEGRRAGAVALASLVKLYGDGTSPLADSLTKRIRQTAEDLARRFPGQPEAEDALVTLVTLSVQAGHADQAQEYLQQLPEDSPKRGMAELSTGQALWSQSFKSPDNNGSAAADDQDDALREQAAALLTSGLQRCQHQPVTPSMVAAALSLAQHTLQKGEPGGALELLEHPTYGPLMLASREDPLMKSPELTQRAYTLALLAYVTELPKANSQEKLVAKAMTTLEALKATVGDDDAGRRQLATTYLSLAQNVRQQIESAPPEGREVLSAAFEQFLERAAASATEENVLSWVADSYLGLGRTLNATDGVNGKGRPYFEKAVGIYQSILQRGASGELSLDANARITAESRLAAAHREMGDFTAALDRFTRILTDQPNQVYVQLEAARTLQQWGDDGPPDAYLKAIRGDRPAAPGQQNLIWGFGRLARIVASSDSLRDVFFEARFRLAQCRFQYALQQPPEQRKTTLAEAERDIVLTARLYPSLGGEQRKAEYEKLLQEIRRSQGRNDDTRN